MKKRKSGLETARIATIEDIEAAFFDGPPEKIYQRVTAVRTSPAPLRLNWNTHAQPLCGGRLATLSLHERRRIATFLWYDTIALWLDGDRPKRQEIMDAGAAKKLRQYGPAQLLKNYPVALEYLDDLWKQTQDAPSVAERNAARRRLGRIWTFQLEDLRTVRRTRAELSDSQIALRYDAALASLKHRVRPARNRAHVALMIASMFPKASRPEIEGLLSWWERRDEAALRPALCRALSRELGLKPSGIRERVASGREQVKQEARRQAQLEEQRRRAWRGYDRLAAWCRGKKYEVPTAPPSVPRPSS